MEVLSEVILILLGYNLFLINKYIRIGNETSIGDNTVIITAGSLPTGIPASVTIGTNIFNIKNSILIRS